MAPLSRPTARGRRASRLTARALVAATLLASASLAAAAAPWSTQIVSGARALLNYPSLIGTDAARALLADRERALTFAEGALGGALFRRLILTIEPTLLTSAALTKPTDEGGAITFYLPIHALTRFEADGTSPFAFVGCHEEVHAVANHLWEANTFGAVAALSEGVAVYVEELRRGTKLHHSIARALQASGHLHDVAALLDGDGPDDPAGIAQLNTYYAGASLVEFLIETYGMEKLAQLYGVEWVRFDVRDPEGGLVEADPGEEILRVYGVTAGQIDAAWRTWIAAGATTSSADADVFLRAFTSDVRRLEAAVVELEEVWSMSPFRRVGPSARVGELYGRIAEDTYALASLRGDALGEAYDAFLRSLDRLDEMLDAWLDAIHAYDRALELARSDGDPDEIASWLEAAEAGYVLAGDATMADTVTDWLAELTGRPAE